MTTKLKRTRKRQRQQPLRAALGSVEFYRAVLRKISESWLDCESAGVRFRQQMALEALAGKWPQNMLPPNDQPDAHKKPI